MTDRNKRPPGLVAPGTHPDVVAMICTAGHVDHGKTSLVRALTGTNTDRLRAERERGLTIETSNAQLLLRPGLAAGIADVPGHERFIRNMVGGVDGVDLALLVVAADDGVMPQTVEHCRVLELLGLERGVVALTKSDMVSPERITEATAEVRAFLAGTFLAEAPILPVSSRSGRGLTALHATLADLVVRPESAHPEEVFRLAIHRVFAKPGSGVVVTGCPQGGRVTVGDRLALHPGGVVGRVRGLQRFKGEVQSGERGQCLALSIPDFAKCPPSPGDLLCPPDHLTPATALHLDLTACREVMPPLRHNETIAFHTGRKAVAGRLLLLEGERLLPGSRGLATVLLDTPLAVAEHDRFILRRPSPSQTMGGGTILALSHQGRRPRRRDLVLRLRAKAATLSGCDPRSARGQRLRVEWQLQDEAENGADTEAIARRHLLPRARAATLLEELKKDGKILALAGDSYIHPVQWRRRLHQIEQRLTELGANPQATSVSAATVRAGLGWPAPLWRCVVGELARAHPGTVREDRFILVREEEQLDPSDRKLLAALVGCYRESGWRSPRPDQLPALLGVEPESVERLLRLLCDRGDLVRLSPAVVVEASLCEEARCLVVDTIRRQGQLDSCLFPKLLGTTRKYGLAFLDYLDRRNVTVRGQHNQRRLRAGYGG